MMKLSEAAAVLHARRTGADVTFAGVSTDTRALEPRQLFVALRGERFDGHGFLRAACDAGAAAAMVDTRASIDPASAFPLLVVDDTRQALGALAAHWRSRFSIPVVALTGSSGKTSVKEMLAAILRCAAAEARAPDTVLATRGNLNNDIGLPLMLLELAPQHRYAVFEMGMNHAGEIRYLSGLAHADVALVTNAGRAHIEYLGSEEAIARAKGEIFETLRADGTAVINADDRFAPLWRELAKGKRRVEFGLDGAAGVTAPSYTLRPFDTDITIETSRGRAATRLAAPGLHNVRNALAASAAAFALDVPLDVIAAGLARFSGIKGRLQRKRGPQGAVLIDDTYNANPDSVRAAIAVLAQSQGRKVLVLGDMGELGPEASRFHAEVGAYAKASGVDRLFTLGENSAHATKTFGAGAAHYARIEDLLSALESVFAHDVTVLVKGSRFMRMERVVHAFAAEEGSP